MVGISGGNLAVAISPAQIAYIEATLNGVKNGAETAIRTAINETTKWGRTQLVKLMREKLNLNAKDIRDRINTKLAKAGNEPTGLIVIDYHAVPLLDFRARYSKRAGVTVTTIKGDGAQHFKHRFKATMQSGHEGIFDRGSKNAPKVVPTKGSYAGRIIKRGPRKGQPMLRQKIQEVFGVSILRAFELDPDLQTRALSSIGDKLKERLASKVQWQLSKATSSVPTEQAA